MKGFWGREAIIAVVCLAMAWPVSGAAQGKRERRVKLSGLQQKLLQEALQEGSRADRSPDFRAVELNLQAALQQGEVDLLYAGLGRALFNQRRCAEAEVAYQKALTSPNSTLMTREDLQVQIEVDRVAMIKECKGTISIECSPGSLEVSVGEQRVICGGSVEVAPGAWPVRWKLGMLQGEQTVQVVGMKTSPVRLEVSREAASLTVRCNPGDMQVWINQREVLCDVPQPVDPGEYEIKGQWRELSTQHTVLVEGGQEKIVGAKDPTEAPPVVRTPPPAAAPREEGVSWWGWTLLTGGVALAGVGGAYSLGVLNLKEAYVNDSLNDQTLALGFYGAGAALALGSLIAFAWSDDPEAPPAAVGAWTQPEGGGLLLRGGW
jgi:hypothetical protein